MLIIRADKEQPAVCVLNFLNFNCGIHWDMGHIYGVENGCYITLLSEKLSF